MSKHELLIELAQTYPLLNVSVTRRPLELLHHFKYMHLASITNQIYFVTPKQTSYDACLFDKLTKNLSSSIEYKFISSETNCFNNYRLHKLVKKYGLEGSNIDKVDIGFMHDELLHKQRETLSSFPIKKMECISFETTDFSSFFHSQHLNIDFEKTAETLFINQQHLNSELCELGTKFLS